MQIGAVVGSAFGTIKHPTLNGWKLLVVQFLTTDAKPDGEPVLAVDSLGAGVGDRVLVTSDGATTQKMLGKNTPARWLTVGIVD